MSDPKKLRDVRVLVKYFAQNEAFWKDEDFVLQGPEFYDAASKTVVWIRVIEYRKELESWALSRGLKADVRKNKAIFKRPSKRREKNSETSEFASEM